MGTGATGWVQGAEHRAGQAGADLPVGTWISGPLEMAGWETALTHPTCSCVCKEGEVGDGRACYGHLLHEVQKAGQIGVVFLRLRLALSMLGA